MTVMNIYAMVVKLGVRSRDTRRGNWLKTRNHDKRLKLYPG